MYTQQYKRGFRYWRKYRGLKVPPSCNNPRSIVIGVLSSTGDKITHLVLSSGDTDVPIAEESLTRLKLCYFNKSYATLSCYSIEINSELIKSFKDYHGF